MNDLLLVLVTQREDYVQLKRVELALAQHLSRSIRAALNYSHNVDFTLVSHAVPSEPKVELYVLGPLGDDQSTIVKKTIEEAWNPSKFKAPQAQQVLKLPVATVFIAQDTPDFGSVFSVTYAEQHA